MLSTTNNTFSEIQGVDWGLGRQLSFSDNTIGASVAPSRGIVAEGYFMETFGEILREMRLDRDYGLREFAMKIGELPSNLSAVETGARAPWRVMEKLVKVAKALGLMEGSPSWDRYFLAARRPETLPDDIDRLLARKINVALLRTVDQKRLTDDQIEDLIRHIESGAFPHGRIRKGRRSS